ncbi:multicopper oxidase [Zopfia rhizophila CBS 207.26]|uniref:Multicopper oxidase n=1 Tax=Zopfia rhizophila CBS 207.26 TaxID=1314779 RepID=A0A6A6DLH8_9PEZI|nr:multicopper oxidase [Zopfia rhizophila CBS 207.26]
MFSPRNIFSALLILLSRMPISHAVLRSYNFTIHTGFRSPDGVPRHVYLINDQQPGPLIEADEGDDVEVFVKNDLSVETTIHWHGILQHGTPQMDGVPGVTQFPIAPGGNYTYRFSLKDEYGFYWYHSHFRAYYDDTIRGPFLIRASPSRRRPFETLAHNDGEVAALLQAERDATPVLLTDWYHRLSDDVFAQYFETGAFPSCVDSLLANGYGRVECLPESLLAAGTGLGMDIANATVVHGSVNTPMPSMTMPSMSIESMESMASMSNMRKRSAAMSEGMATMASEAAITSSASAMPSETSHSRGGSSTMPSMSMPTALNPRGCSPPMMFKPGYNLSSLPPETCSNTTSPLLTIPANSSSGWLALDLVNAGSVTRLSVSLDAHSMFVYAADGLYVSLQEVKVLQMSIGQRYSVMIKLDKAPGDYLLRLASYPYGDMQQVIEGQVIVSYNATASSGISSVNILDDRDASVWMLTNGSAKLNSSTLSERSLSPFEGNMPPTTPATVTRHFTINQTDVVTWVVDGYPYSEPKTPIIYGNVSDAWDANTTLKMPLNSTIDLILRIANDSMDTMGHPMHLHGHKFWVLGTGTGSFPYESLVDAPSSLINLENPPYRDTVDLPPSGWAALRYVTDNPGAWLFHCHIQWHLVSGMALVLVEGEEQLADLVGTQPNTTQPNPSTPSGPTSSGHSDRTAGDYAAFVLIPLLTAGFILSSSLSR